MTDERLTHRSANREDGARLGIVAENFWGRDQQCIFFDVRAFNPYAPSYRKELEPTMKELEKWNTALSPPLFSRLLEAWVLQQLWCTKELPL